jgi:hypothetical protein
MGPGAELKRLLGRIGIKPTDACLCDQRAMLMDEEGPEWCRQNVDVIVEWMAEEAKNRGLPMVRTVAKLIVLRAIRNAKKKIGMSQDD